MAHNPVSDYPPTCVSPDSLTASRKDDSVACSPDSSDSLHPEDDLAHHSEDDYYCHGGNFGVGVGQPPVLVVTGDGDGVVVAVVVLRDRDDVIVWKKLELIRAPHGRGAFGDGWGGGLEWFLWRVGFESVPVIQRTSALSFSLVPVVVSSTSSIIVALC